MIGIGLLGLIAREPRRQSAIARVSFQFLDCHSLKGVRESLVFKLDCLARPSFGSIGNLPCSLYIAAHGISHLRRSNKLGPRPPFRIVWHWFLELALVSVRQCLALWPSRRVAALPFLPSMGLSVLSNLRIVARAHTCF